MPLSLNKYTHEHLLHGVEQLQSFWSLVISPPIPGATMAGIYRALGEALKVFELDEEAVSYIKRKMHDTAPGDASLEEQIAHGIEEAERQREIDRFPVDNRLRCLLMVIIYLTHPRAYSRITLL